LLVRAAAGTDHAGLKFFQQDTRSVG
jgi:hypothetical protein